MADNQIKPKKQIKRWTEAEDKRLLQQIRVFPNNLHKCFVIVSEVTGRSVCACANRWYTKLSKDPANAIFLTVSAKHKSLNRKNGVGVRSTRNLFQRIVKLLGWG